MDQFSEGTQIQITPCLHAFHQNCIDNWISTRADRIIRQLRNNEQDAETEIPCPNCNASIVATAHQNEEEACNELHNVMGLLESSAKFNDSARGSQQDHNDI